MTKITVEEIHEAARREATDTIEKFNELLELPLRELLIAAYIAGAHHVIKFITREEVTTNAH